MSSPSQRLVAYNAELLLRSKEEAAAALARQLLPGRAFLSRTEEGDLRSALDVIATAMARRRPKFA